MLEAAIIAIVLAIIVIAILYIISIWVYKRAPANMGFIRTGFLGTKVCLGRGAIVLPVFHEVSWISLETIKLIVTRSRDQGILTSDKIRVDVSAELYTHVGRTIEDMLTASRSLGDKTFEPDRVRDLLEEGEISIHDDRHLTHPWGILGGEPGGRSEKILVRKDGAREPLASKIDNVKVQNGDRIIFRTAGGGGWGDPLEREPKKVRDDVARKLMSAEAARKRFGVVLAGERLGVDSPATQDLRESMRHSRKPRPLFDFGELPTGTGPGR